MVEHGLLLVPFMNECKTRGMCPYVQLLNSPKDYEIMFGNYFTAHFGPMLCTRCGLIKSPAQNARNMTPKYVWATTPRCVFWASRLDASLNEQKANRG